MGEEKKVEEELYDNICSPSMVSLYNIFGDRCIRTTLRFFGSRDGYMNNSFLLACNLIGPTIFLFKMQSGDIIGGFTAA